MPSILMDGRPPSVLENAVHEGATLQRYVRAHRQAGTISRSCLSTGVPEKLFATGRLPSWTTRS
jgi:hypothetical protein